MENPPLNPVGTSGTNADIRNISVARIAFMVDHKRKAGASAQSLLKFNGPNFEPENQIVMLETAIEKEKALEQEEVSYLDCFKGSNLRRTTIVSMMFFAQQVSGVGFITGYLP